MPKMAGRSLCALLAAALILAAPGLGAYDALAAVLRASVRVNVAPASAVAGAVKLSGIVPQLSSQGLGLPSPSLPSFNIRSLKLEVSAPAAVSANPVAAVSLVPIREASASQAAKAAGRRGEVESAASVLSSFGKQASFIQDEGPNLSDGELSAAASFDSPRTGDQESLPVEAGRSRPSRNLLARAYRRVMRKKDDIDLKDKKGAHLVFEVQDPEFMAGYLAAVLFEPGGTIRRASGGAPGAFLQGFAYRVAEVRGSEAAGKDFLRRARGRGDDGIKDSAVDALAGAPQPLGSLIENLDHPDFVNGYLSGLAWRPGKQLWMPAPSFLQRMNPFMRERMKPRDAKFFKGLLAGVTAGFGSGAAVRVERDVEDGPQAGSREFGVKLAYVLEDALKDPQFEKLDETLPLVPGKVRIPRSLLGLIFAHWIFIIWGIEFHRVSQPFLVYSLTGSKTMMGAIRSIHYAAYSASSFLPLGPAVDKTDYRTMFMGTSVFRSLLMGAIPLLFFTGHLTFAVLAVIVALNPYFQNMMTIADSAAQASILGTNDIIVREGRAFGTKVSSAAHLILPVLTAYLVSLLVIAFGEPGGYAMAYGVYAVLLLVAIPIFQFMVRDPRYHDPSIKTKPTRSPFHIFYPFWVLLRVPLRLLKKLFGRVFRSGKAGGGAPEEEPDWLKEAAARVVPYQKGRRIKNAREGLARKFDRMEATQGVSVIMRSDTLSLLMAVFAVELFVSNALVFVVIPNYIIDIVQPTAVLSWIPVIGDLLSTKVGVMGLIFSLQGVGQFLGAHWSSGVKGDRRMRYWGHKTLFRAAALSGVTFWALMLPVFLVGEYAGGALPLWLFLTSFGILLLQNFIMAFLATPLLLAMAPVQRKQIPNDMVGKVSAAFSMIDLSLVAVGALVIGMIIDVVPIGWAVALIAVALTWTSILEWFIPDWLEKINPPGWLPGEKNSQEPPNDGGDEGGGRTARLIPAERISQYA